MDCIFCRIIAGELPSYTIAENDHALAFLDINPATKGHCLVIPKQHSQDIFDADPAALTAVMQLVQTVAQQLDRCLAPDGINIVQNNRPAAGQVVMHYHVHLIPRRTGDHAIEGWNHINKETIDFPALAEQLRSAA